MSILRSARADARLLACALTVGLLCASSLSQAHAEAASPFTAPVASALGSGDDPALRAAIARIDFSPMGLLNRSAPPSAQAAAGRATTPTPSTPAAQVNGRELDCMAQAVYFEARGEPALGQAAVAQVVLNRVRHPAFPKSVCGVVFQRAGHSCQFSWACHRPGGAGNAGQWAQARAVAGRVMAGEVIASIGLATHFNGARAGGFGGGLQRVARIGAHAFYRFNGAKGAPSMFSSPVRVAQTQAGPSPRIAYASLLPLPSRAEADRLLASASTAVRQVANVAQNAVAGAAQTFTGQTFTGQAASANDRLAAEAAPTASPAPSPAVARTAPLEPAANAAS